MSPRHIAMAAALLVAAGLVVFGDNAPDSGVAEAIERAPPTAAPAPVLVSVAAKAASGGADPAILRLAERADLIGGDDEKLGGGPTVFGSQNWAPPPPPPDNRPPPPPPPPSAPPLPFTYLGKAVGEGSWEVYLARGEKTYNVRIKDVIDGVYRVDAITPPMMTLTYIPLNQVQQLNIGVLD